ncbi:hypothetical protein FJD34_22635 [Pseudomonas brenneri]|uniref:Uncharacterized protein n=1 Tax=Pseudomonas brenneri TaxID=129817 RepID=A0A5B2V2U4_9PSED|nr:hypothetical protein F1720_05120 [Pseudomonas brenneri]TWR75800.1 hypothetical protein FJD34_22635 [Pseudomonas brenneri]
MLAKNVNDNAGGQIERSALRFFASKLAPTVCRPPVSICPGHVVNAPLRGVRRHLVCLRRPYHRIKGPCTGLNNTKGWERRDVQQTRPDPGI